MMKDDDFKLLRGFDGGQTDRPTDGQQKVFFSLNISPIFHSFVFHSLSRGGRSKINDAIFTLSAVFFYFDVFP